MQEKELYVSASTLFFLRTAWATTNTVKTSWLFQPQSGYPGCRQTGDTVIMRGLLWYLRLIAKGNSRAAAQFILQPQYAENPYNICGSLTWLQVPYCNFEVHL